MYRCCQCDANIGWFPAAMSTVASPIRCGGCGIELHRRQPWLAWTLFFAATMASVLFAIIVGEWAGDNDFVRVISTLPLFGTGVAYETWLYRRGETIATSRLHKRLAQGAFFGMLLVLVAGSVLIAYLSPP